MKVYPDVAALRDYAMEMLEYNPDTGNVVWKKQTVQNLQLIGRQDRGVNSSGYFLICLMGKSYLLHRIVFLMTYGFLPEFIDHVNHNRADNRLCNLRAASRMENGRNRPPYKKNSGMPPGVIQHSPLRYRARIRVNKRLIILGDYKTPELAAEKYRQAQTTYFGEFSPV